MSPKLSDRSEFPLSIANTLRVACRSGLSAAVGLVALAAVTMPGAGGASGSIAPPGEIAVVSTSQTSVDLAWGAPSGHVEVAGYDVYWDGVLKERVTEASHTASDLACGTAYAVAVAAFDSADNRSPQTSATVSTSACDVPAPAAPSEPSAHPAPTPPLAPADAVAPSPPTRLMQKVAQARSVRLAWRRSSDNVGVAEYGVYVAGALAGKTEATSYVVDGLACGKSYSVEVDATDAAGNRSGRTSAVVSTDPCAAKEDDGKIPAEDTQQEPAGATGVAGGSDADLYVAVDGSDAGSCSRVVPCRSFDRAYRVAAPGAVVEVAGGSYPVQTLRLDPAKTSSADVVFRPAAGASVTLAEFVTGENRARVAAQHFELRDMRVSSFVRLRWGSEDVTLRNIDAGGIDFASVRDVRVLGGDYGPMVDQVSHIRACGEPGCSASEDVLIDGALFHDYTISYAEKHSECLMIWPGRRVTIRNSTFRNCTDYDVFVKPGWELTFENNLFDEPMPGNTATVRCVPDCPRGGPALAFSAGGGMTVRYNSFLGAIRLDPEVNGPNVFTGNAGRNSTCWPNATFSNNVWTGTTCSSTDRQADLASIFVDPTSSGFDLRVRADGPAAGLGASGTP